MSNLQNKKTVHHPLEFVSAAAAIAAATTAHGESVRFENSANWGWSQALLDVTMSSDSQPYGGIGQVTGSSIYLDYFSDFYPAFSYSHSYTNGGGAEIFSGGFMNNYAKPLAFGEAIGPGLADGEFTAYSTIDFVWSSYDYYTGKFDFGNRGILPSQEDVYLGVRLDIDGATHYGWIGVNRLGTSLEVFAWGYETQAGVSVGAGVPAPGALAVLAFGAVGALKRKKRAV